MSYRTITYLLAGTKVATDWGSLPTDRPGTDDWWQRWSHLLIYDPRPDDLVFIRDMDGKHWAYLGYVIAVHDDQEGSAEFHESMDADWINDKIADARLKLAEEGLEIGEPVKVHLISQFR